MNATISADSHFQDNSRDSLRGSCPMHAGEAIKPSLKPDDELFFPWHKGVYAHYVTEPDGALELRLYFGDNEISFDEPELFAFGETLCRQARFLAGAAVNWGTGNDWPRIRELLQQLLDEKILYRSTDPDGLELPRGGPRPSPLPPAESDRPRTWLECTALTNELTGRSLDQTYLECAIPVFRVAHIALDAEDRQVGEANVFPAALRLERPTEWRSCPHAGSRYQDPKPMNVTALKSMRGYWPQMMAGLRECRAAFIRRFPHVRDGWTVGDLLRFSSLVLALPGYRLLRAVDRVENGTLHPALSSMFRVTDGVQMTTSIMLYSPADEPTTRPDAPLDSDSIYAYAERNALFISHHGVCAGPPAMIREFLDVLLEGKGPDGNGAAELDAPVRAALDEVDAAYDYGLLGLQTYALIFDLWPRMGQTCERLLGILETWPGARTAAAERLRETLVASLASMREINGLDTGEWQERRERVYFEMYARCAEGLGETEPLQSMDAILRPDANADYRREAGQLARLLAQRLCPEANSGAPVVVDLTATLMDYFRLEQATVRAISEVQRKIGLLLGRPPAEQALKASDLTLFYHVRGKTERLPYLGDILREFLDIEARVTAGEIEILDRANAARAAA